MRCVRSGWQRLQKDMEKRSEFSIFNEEPMTNNQFSNGNKKYDLEERTAQFAERVIWLKR